MHTTLTELCGWISIIKVDIEITVNDELITRVTVATIETKEAEMGSRPAFCRPRPKSVVLKAKYVAFEAKTTRSDQ